MLLILTAQSFRGVGGDQSIDHLADIAVDVGVKAVERETDPVIGDAVLWVIVGSYLLASVAASYHRAACARDGVFLLGTLHIVKLCAEHSESLVLVLELRAFLLTFDNDACGLVSQTDCGFGLVDMLTARAA